MNLAELKNRIEELIQQTPYSKSDVLAMFDKEEEYEPDELFAYAVAVEYLREKKSANTKSLEKMLNTRKNKLIKFYKDR